MNKWNRENIKMIYKRAGIKEVAIIDLFFWLLNPYSTNMFS